MVPLQRKGVDLAVYLGSKRVHVLRRGSRSPYQYYRLLIGAVESFWSASMLDVAKKEQMLFAS